MPQLWLTEDRIDTSAGTALTALRTFLDLAMHRSQREIFRRSRETGLSFSQLLILRRLMWRGDASASELSEFLEVSRAALSQAVDRLVESGLVERSEGIEDRRVKIHRISRRGRDLVETIHADRYTWLPALVDGCSTEELESIRAACAALTRSGGAEMGAKAHPGETEESCE